MSRIVVLSMLVVGLMLQLVPVGAWAQNRESRIGMLEIEGKVPARPSEFAWLAGDAKPTLLEVLAVVEGSAARDDIDTLVIRLKDAALTRTQIEEIGEAMSRARDGGRTVHLFAEHYTPAEVLLGTYADSMIIQSGGAVVFPGLYMEEMYLADTLAWIGVRADFVQVGDYKGAAETLSNSGPSPAWEENISQLLDSMYGIIRRDVMRGRNMTDAQLDDAMRRVWVATAEEGIDAGLIDAAVDLPELGRHLAGEAESRFVTLEAGKKRGRDLDASNPFAAISAMMEMFTRKPRHRATRPTIAVLHIDGAIVDGDSTPSGLFGGASVGSRTIRNALEEIRADQHIKGVIVRVDSPGGSATASEVMWQGIRRVADEKPVWVSVGSMAASGGYYVAVAGDRIYVNPSSVVGSIGVVGGKLALGGLYEQLGINIVARGRGPMAEMFSTSRPRTDEQRQLVRLKMTEVYDKFAGRVVQGRNGIDLGTTAEGRLFTGDRAIELKMADRIGGLETAVEDLARDVGLERWDVMHYPGPRGFDELLKDLFGGLGADAGAPRSVVARELVQALGEALGANAWSQISAQMEAMAQLRREPAVLVSPRALIFR
jgi:protease IV